MALIKNELHKLELTEEYKLKIEKRINSFSESYMNNSKWKRVFTELLKRKEIIKKCEIFDFFNSGINEIKWGNVNDNYLEYITQEYITNNITTSEYPMTFYKEIEYIEFPKFWFSGTKCKLINNRKKINQNTDIIKEKLSKIGQFKWEENDETLKLIGYRNN